MRGFCLGSVTSSAVVLFLSEPDLFKEYKIFAGYMLFCSGYLWFGLLRAVLKGRKYEIL